MVSKIHDTIAIDAAGSYACVAMLVNLVERVYDVYQQVPEMITFRQEVAGNLVRLQRDECLPTGINFVTPSGIFTVKLMVAIGSPQVLPEEKGDRLVDFPTKARIDNALLAWLDYHLVASVSNVSYTPIQYPQFAGLTYR